MDLTSIPEHEELRQVVRGFLKDWCPTDEVRRQMEREEGYDRSLWRRMGQELGILGLLVPEEFGGMGAGVAELAVVLEELGRALLPAPYLSTAVVAASTLLAAGDDTASKEILPGIAAGDLVATLAWTEPQGSWDPAAATVRAQPSGSEYRLTGTKSYVLDGHVADAVLVTAQAPAGLSLFRVAGNADGLARRPLSTMDQTRKLAELDFDGALACLVGREGTASAVLEHVLDLAAIALAAEQLGGAQYCLDAAVDYAKKRFQFGRPIGSFQAVKHKCADMLLRVENARSAVAYAAWCAHTEDTDLPLAAAIAKAYCSEAYVWTATQNIQIHGGVGFTWEHPAHLYLKRAKSTELLFGDGLYHRRRLAHLLSLAPDQRQGRGPAPWMTA